MTIGDIIRKTREEKGLSRHKLSILSDVDGVVIKKVEDGSHHPSYWTLCQLCKGFGVTPNDLIPESDYKEA